MKRKLYRKGKKILKIKDEFFLIKEKLFLKMRKIK